MKRFCFRAITLVGACLAAALLQAQEAISINFNGSLSSGTNYGAYPVDGGSWKGTSGGSGSDIPVTGNIKLSFTSSGTWALSSSWISEADAMLNGYLDDGQETRITLTGLDTTAFATYDLYIYMVADTTPSTAGHFIAPEVNGVKYTTGGKAGDANWGNRGTYQRPVLDVNTLRIVGLSNTTGEVVIRFDAVTNRGQGRSCVSAIQVVKSQPQLSHTVGSGENLWSTGWMGGGCFNG